jgi:cystathionine gamma-lyase
MSDKSIPQPSTLRPSTLAIHTNRSYETMSNSILFPIYQTATYIHDTVGVTRGYIRVGQIPL